MSRSYLAANAVLVLAFLIGGAALAAGAALRASEGLSGIFYQPAKPSFASATDRKQESGLLLGVFDPDEQFSRTQGIVIDEYFLNWSDYTQALFENQINFSKARNRMPLVLIEPQPFAGQREALLRDVIQGLYEERTTEVCADVAASAHPVVLAWGPMMDVPTGSPWSDAPDNFREAYRHFVAQCRSIAPNAYFMWAPWGGPRMADYWPGEGVVDFIGLPVLVDAERDGQPGALMSFEELFAEKYRAVEGYGRPVWVAELGVPGRAAEQAAWLDHAKRSNTKFPLLQAIVYFDAVGIDSKQIDWRISNWTLIP